MVTLAALDLRRYIEKISGARLPIVTAPDASAPVKIYVGQSPAAAKLGVTAEGLQNGAFRIASGPGWLALVGEDKDLVPTKMTGMSRGDPRPIEEWNRLTAGKTKGAWCGPAGGEFKFLWTPKGFAESLNGYYGDDAFGLWKEGGNTLNGFWRQDNDGSMMWCPGSFTAWACDFTCRSNSASCRRRQRLRYGDQRDLHSGFSLPLLGLLQLLQLPARADVMGPPARHERRGRLLQRSSRPDRDPFHTAIQAGSS